MTVDLGGLLLQVAIGLVPLGVAFFAFRASSDANKRTQQTALVTAERQAEIERSKVDAEAFERARGIYQDALGQMEKQVDRLQERFDRIGEQLAREQNASSGMRAQILSLQSHISHLEGVVAALRHQMTAAGLSPVIPPLEPPPEGGARKDDDS